MGSGGGKFKVKMVKGDEKERDKKKLARATIHLRGINHVVYLIVATSVFLDLGPFGRLVLVK